MTRYSLHDNTYKKVFKSIIKGKAVKIEEVK